MSRFVSTRILVVLLSLAAPAFAQVSYIPEGADRQFSAELVFMANCYPMTNSHFLAGWELFLKGNESRADKEFEAGSKTRGSDYACLHGGALIAFLRSNLDKAEAAYGALIAAYPQDYFSYYKLGTISLLRGDFAKAEERLAKALEVNPQGRDALLQLGTLYAMRGDTAAKAITSLRRAFPAYDENPELNYELGQLYYQRKSYAEAAYFYDRAIKLGIKGPAQRTALGKALYYQGKYDDADNILRRVVKDDGKFVEAHYYLGAVLLAQKKYPRAAASFEKVEKLQRGFAEARFYLAQAQYNQGLYPQAMANLMEYRMQKLLARDAEHPALPESMTLMLDIESRQGIKRLPTQVPGSSEGMVTIPAGLLLYGFDGGNAETMQLQMQPFLIDAREVSNAEYAVFVKATGSAVPQGQGGGAPAAKLAWDAATKAPTEKNADLPVFFVSWNDAVAYAAWTGKRLPYESEWEWAARGGLRGTAYPWGANAPNGDECRFRSDEGPRPVTEGAKNGYGLLNIVGNAAEWCADVFDTDLRAGLAQRSETAAKGAKRSYRGGHWRSGPEEVKCSSRGGLSPGTKSPFIGFRCAQDTPANK